MDEGTPPSWPLDPPGRELRAGPIVGGIALGVIVCWVWITLMLVIGLSTAYGADSNALAAGAVAVAASPVLVGVVLLIRPRTRLMGAGFLMGLSIGMIAGAGVCASLFVPGMV